MSGFLQFWGKLNTRGIVKTYPFHFLRDYYRDFLNVMFPKFPNHFLPLPIVFPHVFPSLSTIFLSVSSVSTQILRKSTVFISQYLLQASVIASGLWLIREILKITMFV